jgi:hypothetical protein
MLFNKEDLPLELFVQHLRKKQVPEETGFDSNLLSPMDSKWT